jgi:hypothetical protein
VSLNQNPLVGNAPIVDPRTGVPTLAFFAWMRSLFERTGGEVGVSSEELELLAILAQGQSERADQPARALAESAYLEALFRPQPKTDVTQALLFAMAQAQATQHRPTSSGVVLLASEAIAAGDLTNAYVNTGVMTVRKADASDPAKFCNSFSLTGIGNAKTGPIQFSGFNNKVTVSTGAPEVWLSDITPGAFTDTAPTTAGHLLQTVGTAVLGLGLAYAQGNYVIL